MADIQKKDVVMELGWIKILLDSHNSSKNFLHIYLKLSMKIKKEFKKKNKTIVANEPLFQ